MARGDRLQRLRSGARYKEADARVSESKEKLARYKSQAQTNRNTRALTKQIRSQEARRKKSGSAFKKTTKAYGYKPKLSRNLLAFGNAFGGGRQQPTQGNRPVGRPAGPASYKHRSPFTGKPIPATEYYKERRAARRLREQQAQQVDAQQITKLVRQGIPPEQARAIVNTRQLQSQGVPVPQDTRPSELTPEQIRQQMIQRQQEEEQRLQPVQSNAVRPIWRRQVSIGEEVDAMGNRRQVLRGNDPRGFWN